MIAAIQDRDQGGPDFICNVNVELLHPRLHQHIAVPVLLLLHHVRRHGRTRARPRILRRCLAPHARTGFFFKEKEKEEKVLA